MPMSSVPCAALSNLTATCHTALVAQNNPKLTAALADPTGQEIHASVMESIMRHATDLPPLPMGGTPRSWRKANRARIDALTIAVKADMSKRWEVYLGIGAGLIVLFMGGLGYLVLMIMAACLVWCVERFLDQRDQMESVQRAMGVIA